MENIEKDNLKMWVLHNLIIGVLMIGLLVAVFHIMLLSFDKSAIVTCEKLLDQSVEFSNAPFFVTYFEKEMCDSHGYQFAGTRAAPVNHLSVPNGKYEFDVWYFSPNAPEIGLWQLDYDIHKN